MRLLFLDTKANNPNRYIARAAYRALARCPGVSQAVWGTYREAIPLALETPFDAFLAFDGEEANNPVIERLCKIVPRRAIWFTEDPYEAYRNAEVARHFDLVFTNDQASAASYPVPARHLPLAADPETLDLPVGDEPHLHDLFFAGTAWPNRLAFLKELRARRPDLRMKLVLVENPALKPHIAPFKGDFTYSPGVSIQDFGRLANRSLLTLALPRRFSTDPANPEAASDTPGPRLFEAALAGAAQLVDRGTTPIAATLFDPERDFLSYATLEECVAAIDRARADPERIRAMARAAQEACRARHLYGHRAAEIVAALRELEPRSRPAPARRRRALYLAHNTLAQGFFGGAEVYLDEITRHAAGTDAFILAPDRRPRATRNAYALTRPDGAVVETLTLGRPLRTGDLSNPDFEALFQGLLARHAFDLVHVNHLMWFPPTLLPIARASGARVVYSLHDYYPVCEIFDLIGFEERYCDIPNRPHQTCDLCLQRVHGWGPGSQARRRRAMRESFRAVDRVLVGSKASADIFLSLFPHVEGRTTLVPPPLPRRPERRAGGSPSGPRLKVEPRLKVGLLGNFARNKGAQTALQVFELARDLPIDFAICGRVDPELAPTLKGRGFAHVVQHGPFTPGSIPDALRGCDVALVLSPWPETYCISLTELQALGLVPIVTDLGAQGERVEHGRNGFKVAVNDAPAVARLLEELAAHPERLEALREALPQDPGWEGPAFAQAVEAVYDELLAGRELLPEGGELARPLALDELDLFLHQENWLALAPVQGGGATRLTLGRSRQLVQRFVYFSRTYGLRTAVSRGLYWLKMRRGS